MKTIPLTRGYFTEVDNDDYEKFSVYRWKATGQAKYIRASRCAYDKETKTSNTLYLAREIMNASKEIYVDHINHNTLDNRKKNLRFCTASQNGMNRGKQKNNKSGYKGVSWHEGDRKWRARISMTGKTIFLGNFNNKKEAVEAYDEAAKKYHGEFAKTNVANVECALRVGGI